MQSVTLIFCVLLFQHIFAQELGDVEPPQTNDGLTTTEATDWVTNGREVSRMTNHEFRQPRLTSYYELPFGQRIQQQNMSGPAEIFHPRFASPLEGYSVNWTEDAEPFAQPTEDVRYPLPPFVYYPQTDMMQYPQPADFENLHNRAFRNGRHRHLPPPLPAYPEPVRLERTRSFPIPFGLFPESDYFLRRDAGLPNPGNALPYSYPPEFLIPPSPNSGEDKPPYQANNIVDRPPYYDREPGSEYGENFNPIRNISLPPLPAEPVTVSSELEPVEVPAPLEPVPLRMIPRRPFPLGAFPFGLPQRELIPPFQLPPGILPPVIPPPTLPPQLPVNEDVFTRVPPVQTPPPPPPAEPIVSETLPPEPPVLPGDPEIDAAAANQPAEDIDVNARIPYEFGYEMNDGMGTDQHRKESGDGTGSVTGSYGYKDADGVYRIVNYIADKNGFRAFIQTNEPGVANPGSADVVVRAERPPLKTIEDGLRNPNVDIEEISDAPLEVPTEPIIRK